MSSFFIIKEINEGDYNRFLLWMSFESLIDHLDNIEEDPSIIHSSGRILIDQLFITGDGKNRFICCNFENGKLDLKTAHVVIPMERFYKETIRMLHDNCNYLENSILTENQRLKIKNGLGF